MALNDSFLDAQCHLSLLSFLMNEILSLFLQSATGMDQVERKIKDLGASVGIRAFEALAIREKFTKRENTIAGMLTLISNQLFKSLFGRVADSIERNTENSTDFMIWENCPVHCQWLSPVPKDYGEFTPAVFTAGVIESVLNASNFPCTVTAHPYASGMFPNRTVYLIKLGSGS